MALTTRVLLTLPAILTGALHAQTTTQLTLPESHRTVEGTGTTNVPFGRTTPMLVQQAYDGMLFPGTRTISGIAFRLDGGAIAVPKQVDVEIRLSTMPLPLPAMSPVFAQNRGVDMTATLPRQVVTLAGQSNGVTPSPFLTPIAFTRTFVYDPSRGPLLVEIEVYGQPPGSYSLDTTWVCTSPDLAFGPAACAGSVHPLRVESATTQVIWGRPWVARVLDAPPNALTTLVLGTIDSGNWNGWNLPFDLAPLGAPGCFVSIDLAASFFRPAAPDGSVTYPFAIPNMPMALGMWIRFQAGALDLAANAMGVITSQAHKVQVCGWEPVGRVWAAGSAATMGQWEMGVAPVVQVTIQ
jgi:hypothetical protein